MNKESQSKQKRVKQFADYTQGPRENGFVYKGELIPFEKVTPEHSRRVYNILPKLRESAFPKAKYNNALAVVLDPNYHNPAFAQELRELSENSNIRLINVMQLPAISKRKETIEAMQISEESRSKHKLDKTEWEKLNSETDRAFKQYKSLQSKLKEELEAYEASINVQTYEFEPFDRFLSKLRCYLKEDVAPFLEKATGELFQECRATESKQTPKKKNSSENESESGLESDDNDDELQF